MEKKAREIMDLTAHGRDNEIAIDLAKEVAEKAIASGDTRPAEILYERLAPSIDSERYNPLVVATRGEALIVLANVLSDASPLDIGTIAGMAAHAYRVLFEKDMPAQDRAGALEYLERGRVLAGIAERFSPKSAITRDVQEFYAPTADFSYPLLRGQRNGALSSIVAARHDAIRRAQMAGIL